MVVKLLFGSALCLIIALVIWNLNRQYDNQYRDLCGRKAVVVVVEANDGIDAIMNRALGNERDKYFLEVVREVFFAFNGPSKKMLQPGEKVLVPEQKKEEIKLAQN